MNFVGHDWWEQVGSWRPLTIASKLWHVVSCSDATPANSWLRPVAASFPTQDLFPSGGAALRPMGAARHGGCGVTTPLRRVRSAQLLPPRARLSGREAVASDVVCELQRLRQVIRFHSEFTATPGVAADGGPRAPCGARAHRRAPTALAAMAFMALCAWRIARCRGCRDAEGRAFNGHVQGALDERYSTRDGEVDNGYRSGGRRPTAH